MHWVNEYPLNLDQARSNKQAVLVGGEVASALHHENLHEITNRK